jgi:competence protein ComGC
MSTYFESRKIIVLFFISFHILLILGCFLKRKKGKKEKGRQTIDFLDPPVNP